MKPCHRWPAENNVNVKQPTSNIEHRIRGRTKLDIRRSTLGVRCPALAQLVFAMTAAGLLALAGGCGTTNRAGDDPGRPVIPAGCPWGPKIQLIDIGTRRELVEQILPPYGGMVMPLRRFGCHILKYWLDDQWLVTITYDYHGANRKPDGTVDRLDSPANRVIAPIRIERKLRTRQRP